MEGTIECHGCFQRIPAGTATCPLCETFVVGPAPPPPLRTGGAWIPHVKKWAINTAIGAVVLSVVQYAVCGHVGVLAPGETAVKTIVEGSIAAPATIKYQSVKVIEKSGDWVVGRAVFDSQNQFGAMLRSHLCVVGHVDGDMVKWDRLSGAEECPNAPSPDYIRLLKGANGWPGMRNTDDEFVPDWLKKKGPRQR